MHVRRVHSPDELSSCLHIRRAVFMQEQGVSEADEIDGLDSVCRHFLATPDKTSPPQAAMGTARLLFIDDSMAKAQRVAVLSPHRGRGVGAALMFALEGEAARANRSVVVLGSQLSALRFYEKLGYAPFGETFLDAGIEHRMMRKNVL